MSVGLPWVIVKGKLRQLIERRCPTCDRLDIVRADGNARMCTACARKEEGKRRRKERQFACKGCNSRVTGKWYGALYCSTDCRLAHSGRRVDRICGTCGLKFVATIGRIAGFTKSNSSAKFWGIIYMISLDTRAIIY